MRRLFKRVSLAIGIAAFTASVGRPAELPIREVVLYKHGVGFFERSGSIPAGDTARLDFKASEMNDVLKSLMINGKSATAGGGRVAGLRYDSSIPLDQKLSEFPFRIDASQPLSGVLDQLKGARLEMQVGNDKLSGAIVAARTVAGDKDRVERQQIVLLVDSGDMRTFDLDAASSIRFTDPKLQEQFRDYLGALTASRSKDKRSVYIDGDTASGRDITAAYIIPTPIWKSSYRLLFPETGEPTLEGWAIVDNTTGEDWTNVSMALVSGKPISFISELYSPRYIARMQAELPEEQALRPELHEGGMGSGSANGMSAGMGGGVGPPPPVAAPQMEVMSGTNSSNGLSHNLRAYATSVPKFKAESTIIAGAAGSEIADLFEYRIQRPVTIKKNESAMLPFLQDKVKARKVDIYSDSGSQHPLNAAELTNSTAKTLDGGPITVYEGGGYVGEALVETVKANDKRLISYGVDLGMRVTNKLDSVEREEREIHLKRGVLTIRAATVRKTVYSMTNVDAKPKILIIEHPLNEEFNVLNQKPSEVTGKARRFEVKLAGSSSQSFPIVEEKLEDEEQAVTSLTPDAIVGYTRNKSLSETARRDLEQIAEVKRQIAANGADAQLTQGRVANASQDEERVRKNLESLNRVSGQQELVQKYATQLSELEQKIAVLRDHEGELGTKNAQLEAALNERLDKLVF